MVSLLIKQNHKIHQFHDLLNWEKFDWTWEWCSRRTPLIMLKLFFVFSWLALAKSLRPGSVNGVLSTLFKRRVQLGGSGWDNYKLQGVLLSISLPPPTSHLACQFLYNFFVEAMSNEHQAIVLICACIHKRTKSLLKVPLFLYQSLLKKLHNCWTFWLKALPALVGNHYDRII